MAKLFSDRTLTALFLQLAHMEEAGIPPFAAFQSLERSGVIGTARSRHILMLLKNGRKVSEAALAAGIFREADAEILRAAEYGGRTGHAYRMLAAHYGAKEMRRRLLRARMALPVAVFILALFIAPIPALYAGQMDGFGYLRATVGRLMQIGVGLYLAWHLPAWLGQGPLRFLGLGPFLQRLAVGLPLAGPSLRRRQLRNFLHMAGLLLEAGVPLAEAWPKATSAIPNPVLRRQVKNAGKDLRDGATAEQAFCAVAGMKPTLISLLASAEQSGRLAESLLHAAALESDAINIEDAVLAEWLPRLVYFLVIGTGASALLSGGLPSSLPPQLR